MEKPYEKCSEAVEKGFPGDIIDEGSLGKRIDNGEQIDGEQDFGNDTCGNKNGDKSKWLNGDIVDHESFSKIDEIKGDIEEEESRNDMEKLMPQPFDKAHKAECKEKRLVCPVEKAI